MNVSDMMTPEVITSLVYAVVGAGSGGVTWVSSKQEFKDYVEVYGKKAVWAVSTIASICWPLSLGIAAILYKGKQAVAAEKAKMEAEKAQG